MGTKAMPGRFDCYARAADDEPMFTLLGRDPTAGPLVNLWVELRGLVGKADREVDEEARMCADTMRDRALALGKVDAFEKASHVAIDWLHSARMLAKLAKLVDAKGVEDTVKAVVALTVARDAIEQKLKKAEERIFAVCNEQDTADGAIRRAVGAGAAEATIDAVARCAADANKASEILSRVRLALGAHADEDTVPALERVLEETKRSAIAGTSRQEVR